MNGVLATITWLLRKMDEENLIDVGKSFSKFPAGRFRKDGRYSGERFREEFLVPALEKGTTVTVLLDDVAGYGPSFLEEAFGGLVRKRYFDKESLKARLKLVTDRKNRKMMIVDFINGAVSE